MKRVKMFVGRAALWMLGWRVEGEAPKLKQCVMIGHPHTSTWDFPLFIFTIWALDISVCFLGKKSLFDSIFGRMFYALGGLPVDRSGGQNTVQAVKQLFDEREELILGLSPAGTRKSTPHWRSGFYHMALAAGVPLVCGSLDFKHRRGVLLGTVHLTGDAKADMDKVRALYTDVGGRNPERTVPIRLSAETEE